MRPIVEAVVDQGSFFEMGRMFGRGIITGLARIDGLPVAVMASDPFFYGGAWTADACQKIVRFVDLAETFHLPVVYLCDCPGFHIGLEAEKSGDDPQGRARDVGDLPVDVPWCTFIVRNVFGVAGAANQPSGRFSIRYAWPSARWGSLPLEGGIEAAYRAEIDAAPDRDAKIAEIEERLQQAALAVPHRRDLLDRGDHRPARHPPPRRRIRQPGRKAARTRRAPLLHAAVSFPNAAALLRRSSSQ